MKIVHNNTLDIFQIKSQVIVNPVNCDGVMGAGLALAFKNRFPQNFKQYNRVCSMRNLRPGMINIGRINQTKYIFNFPTKDHWKDPSQLDYIQSGMESLVKHVRRLNIRSVAIPALGCGLGGLSYEEVLPIIENVIKEYCYDLDTTFYILAP